MRGQLSAEMLILIVVVLAVLAIVASQLLSTAEEGSQQAEAQSQQIFEQARQQARGDVGDSCIRDDQCESNLCGTNNQCL